MKAEDGSTGQVTEHHFKKKESGEESGEKDEVESARKQIPRACKWLSWWKKRWPVSNNIKSREENEKEKIPSTEKEKEPEGADKT